MMSPTSTRGWGRQALVVALVVTLAVAVAAMADTSETAGAETSSSVESDSVPTFGDTPESMVPYRRTTTAYRKFYTEPYQFRGPGAGKVEPPDPERVPIGLVAPLEASSDTVLGQDLHDGVALALEEANADGGYRGAPFEMVVRNDQALWGSSSNTLVDLAYREGVWAIIGSIDSNSTHVALRAALKAEVMIVNVGSTDPTVTETGIPWIIRCTPDDRQTGYQLARLLFEEEGLDKVAVVRSSDRYGRFGVAEFKSAARRLGRPLPMEILFEVGKEDFAFELDRLADSEVEAVVLWARVDDGARLVRQMRERGMEQLIVGTDRLAVQEFVELAGPAAEGVMVTRWMDPDREERTWLEFKSSFERKFGRAPGVFAAYGYDAGRLVVQSIRKVGLNRIRIRDDLAALRGYVGVAGPMRFDTTYNNVAQPLVAVYQGGRLVAR